jgi:hypothetical protein
MKRPFQCLKTSRPNFGTPRNRNTGLESVAFLPIEPLPLLRTVGAAELLASTRDTKEVSALHVCVGCDLAKSETFPPEDGTQ